MGQEKVDEETQFNYPDSGPFTLGVHSRCGRCGCTKTDTDGQRTSYVSSARARRA